MAKSGKKNKKADSGKQKNKKGKAQEGSDAPTPQLELPSTGLDEQQLAAETPLPEDTLDLTAAPTPEPEPQSTTEAAPEAGLEPSQEPLPTLESAPEKELQTEPAPPTEQVQTPSAFEDQQQSPSKIDGFTQIIEPENRSNQSTDMSATQVQNLQEPTYENFGAWGQFGSIETKNENDDTPALQSNPTEPPEGSPITAPQSPVFTSGPETVTEPTEFWPASEENDQTKASAPQEEGSPTKKDTDISHDSTSPFAKSGSSEPTSEPAPAPEVTPTLASGTEPEPVNESEPAKEPEPMSVHEPATEPEPIANVEAVMRPERTIDPAQEVTPPVSKPQSPAPPTASPSYKSASPMQRTISPAAISVADTVDMQQAFPPIPPPTAPTPPIASPKSQHAPPVKDAVFTAPRAAPPTPPSASPLYQQTYPADQPYSPRQKPVSSSHIHQSPVRKSSSPLPKVSSPLSHAYTSPVMSPHTAPLPPMPPSFPPSISHSYASAYQSPPMSSGGFFPSQYGYYQPTSHPHPMQRGSMAPNGGNPFSGMRDQGYGHENERSGRGPIIPQDQEDARELLERIQEAIPDINRLLGTFKHTKTKLQSREAEFKQMESQHKQALMHKEFFIEALQNQLRKTANESAEEATKLKNMINELRMELGNMEEKRKDMEEKLADSEEGKTGLQEQVKKLNENIEEERVAHDQELEKQRAEKDAEKEEALSIQKQDLTELFEEIKAEDEKAAAETLATRETELQEQQEAMKTEYEQQKQQMQESHNNLQAEFDAKLTELATTQEELEQKHKELEDTRKEHTEQVESLENSHQEKVNEMERVWNEERTGLETQLSEKSEELANSEKENKRLEEDVLGKEKQLVHSTDNMRLTIENLGKDCDRLKKTLYSLGEATDLKSTKGDTFFLDCFGQLQRLIVTLSKEHFSYLPIDPPQEVLSKLPPDLPSFLDNTPASCELRSAYVQHVVSKTLTYRIFHPFLFTLGRRYDKADILFQMLSMDIRRKSVRREAFWRQQTLKAAYTTSDAKESINVVAAVIVDEISNHLKHLADPRRMDSLLTGIRKIVKLAAETWRHARVERELILASLPGPEDINSPTEDWEEYEISQEHDSGDSQADLARHVVLRPFPRIIREAAHEDFIGDESKANPCTYSQGAVLYSDSPIILARLQELAKKSTDALAGAGNSSRRQSRASNYSEPLSPLPTEIPYMPNDTLIEGATGANFGTV
ncbi:uncharacterized protein APUU_21785S [Aspergillus puulaauensis]|uniref:RNA polymerase Rpb1 C-terminal repeat domain-containing protein n=1 Tax=Aspergillus puulaauensis TaxID=1220207 RepID=A0A7R8ALB5_9EURO|nr:uncharacterized protein APUU_21785S [Aspergillus puulaauensis]BCS21353.1 hypothetical protein APUU_21785S [Aspergillus puulaauensis]